MARVRTRGGRGRRGGRRPQPQRQAPSPQQVIQPQPRVRQLITLQQFRASRKRAYARDPGQRARDRRTYLMYKVRKQQGTAKDPVEFAYNLYAQNFRRRQRQQAPQIQPRRAAPIPAAPPLPAGGFLTQAERQAAQRRLQPRQVAPRRETQQPRRVPEVRPPRIGFWRNLQNLLMTLSETQRGRRIADQIRNYLSPQRFGEVAGERVPERQRLQEPREATRVPEGEVVGERTPERLPLERSTSEIRREPEERPSMTLDQFTTALRRAHQQNRSQRAMDRRRWALARRHRQTGGARSMEEYLYRMRVLAPRRTEEVVGGEIPERERLQEPREATRVPEGEVVGEEVPRRSQLRTISLPPTPTPSEIGSEGELMEIASPPPSEGEEMPPLVEPPRREPLREEQIEIPRRPSSLRPQLPTPTFQQIEDLSSLTGNEQFVRDLTTGIPTAQERLNYLQALINDIRETNQRNQPLNPRQAQVYNTLRTEAARRLQRQQAPQVQPTIQPTVQPQLPAQPSQQAVQAQPEREPQEQQPPPRIRDFRRTGLGAMLGGLLGRAVFGPRGERIGAPIGGFAGYLGRQGRARRLWDWFRNVQPPQLQRRVRQERVPAPIPQLPRGQFFPIETGRGRHFPPNIGTARYWPRGISETVGAGPVTGAPPTQQQQPGPSADQVKEQLYRDYWENPNSQFVQVTQNTYAQQEDRWKLAYDRAFQEGRVKTPQGGNVQNQFGTEMSAPTEEEPHYMSELSRENLASIQRNDPPTYQSYLQHREGGWLKPAGPNNTFLYENPQTGQRWLQQLRRSQEAARRPGRGISPQERKLVAMSRQRGDRRSDAEIIADFRRRGGVKEEGLDIGLPEEPETGAQREEGAGEEPYIETHGGVQVTPGIGRRLLGPAAGVLAGLGTSYATGNPFVGFAAGQAASYLVNQAFGGDPGDPGGDPSDPGGDPSDPGGDDPQQPFPGTPAQLLRAPQYTTLQQQAFSSALNQALQGLRGGIGFEFDPIERRARRQFREETVPSLAERFTAMGPGARTSRAFGRTLGQAGAELEEGLGALRSRYNLQQQPLLQNLLRTGLTPQYESYVIKGQPPQQPLPQQPTVGQRAAELGGQAAGYLPWLIPLGIGAYRAWRGTGTGAQSQQPQQQPFVYQQPNVT